VRLSVVVVVDDGYGCVLLTRRTPHMRTFPRCWVCPGGAVDDGENLFAAGAREVLEETGLTVPTSDMEMLCLFESVYPMQTDHILQAGGIKSHSLIVFFKVTCPKEQLSKLRLQQAETDLCAWVPLDRLRAMHLGEEEPSTAESIPGYRSITQAWDGNLSARSHYDMANLVPTDVDAAQLRGIYPNPVGEGIGQAILFAIGLLVGAVEY